jgi:hypothetical protein
MRRYWWSAALALGAVALVAPLALIRPPSRAARPGAHLTLPAFEAAVHQGPDGGLAVGGVLTLTRTASG